MKSEKEFKEFLNNELNMELAIIEKKREKLLPRYGKFCKRVLIIGALSLVSEILIRVFLTGWKGILFTPMAVGAIIVFGLIIKGVLFAFSIGRFQALFNQQIGFKVAKFLVPDMEYNALYSPQWSMLSASNIFYDHGAAEGASHFKGRIDGIDLEFFHFDIEYILNTYGQDFDKKLTQKSGLFFAAHLNRQAKGNVIIRKRARKNKKSVEMLKELMTIYNSANQGLLSFFAEAYEIYQEAKQDPKEVLPPEVIKGMNKFADTVKFPVTFSLSGGDFFYFIESGSFCMIDRDEVNGDISLKEIAKRYYNDIKLALESISILDLNKLNK